MNDYIIIGAGLSGLNAAKKITELGLGNTLILEKSRGIGGRMATRRTLDTRFDHGAQFYRSKRDISELHQIWSNEKISHQWFISSAGDHWCAHDGMTALAKKIGLELEIQLEKQIHTISFENDCWKLVSDTNEEWLCRQLIISAPLPQALQIIERSNITISESLELKNISYTKAVIALVCLDEDMPLNEFGYSEFHAEDFFSISDQKRKGLSKQPALTITMSPTFSEKSFDLPDQELLNLILKTFKTKYPGAKVIASELKKWRYCQPSSTYKNLFLEVMPKLYLIGDAFGGSSILGAVRSSEKLCDYLKEQVL